MAFGRALHQAGRPGDYGSKLFREGPGNPVRLGKRALSCAKTRAWPLTWHFTLARPLCGIR